MSSSGNDNDKVNAAFGSTVKTQEMVKADPEIAASYESVGTLPTASVATTTEGASRKRKKLSGDERINRNRERNRLHARKTRERKKNQTAVLQNRISELQKEGQQLRQMIDEQYTASSLLGLSHGSSNRDVKLVPSAMICGNHYESLLTEHSWLAGDATGAGKDGTTQKRVRRSGKYSPQERERIRRERNRMHAKKTRDRKKFFLEISDKLIDEMEAEARKLRSYLLALEFISEEDVKLAQQRDHQARVELNSFKMNGNDDSGHDNSGSDSGDDDEEGGEEDEHVDNTPNPQREPNDALQKNEGTLKEPVTKRRKKVVINHPSDEDPSVSGGSEENEKSSEWSSSNDGQSSNQDSSLTGSTSRESGIDSSNKPTSSSESGESGNSLSNTVTSATSASESNVRMGTKGAVNDSKEISSPLDYQHLLHHNSNHLQHLLMRQQHQQFGPSVGQYPIHPSHPNYLLLEQYLLQNPLIPIPSAATLDAAKALNALGFAAPSGLESCTVIPPVLRGDHGSSTHKITDGKRADPIGAVGDSVLYHPSMVTAPSSSASKSVEAATQPSRAKQWGTLAAAESKSAMLNPAAAAVTATATHYNLSLQAPIEMKVDGSRTAIKNGKAVAAGDGSKEGKD